MRRREGFTLIEILVVVSLLGVLMGLTVGLIARSGGGNLLLQSSNKVASLLSMARNASVGSEAFVSLIPGEHGTTARAYRHRQVFHWPCEDFVRASEIEILKKQGGVVIATGGLPSREGYHAQFSVGGKITLGTPPWLQMRDGVSIECLINPDLGAQMGRMVLFRKGRTYVVRLVRSGVDAYDVEAEIRVQEDDRAKSRNVTVRTGFRAGAEVPEWQAPVLAGRWQQLRISYDRNKFSIFVDGRARGERIDTHDALEVTKEPFDIGGGYAGGFDSLVIAGIFEDDDDRFVIPEIVEWLNDKGEPAEKTKRIYYNNRGLDPRRHPKPETVRLRMNNATRVVHIAISGEIITKRGDQ